MLCVVTDYLLLFAYIIIRFRSVFVYLLNGRHIIVDHVEAYFSHCSYISFSIFSSFLFARLFLRFFIQTSTVTKKRYKKKNQKLSCSC